VPNRARCLLHNTEGQKRLNVRLDDIRRKAFGSKGLYGGADGSGQQKIVRAIDTG
jgi:hypothetical protein